VEKEKFGLQKKEEMNLFSRTVKMKRNKRGARDQHRRSKKIEGLFEGEKEDKLGTDLEGRR